ncbi:YolD-like family protein [Sporosarcina saromensis]|uniref:YolD-like family protein n=1 Tax=Sporosarcina saromensis TaxID=359365 RepID=A0ABU4G7F7_9BACL|nr:YolD-like family protein [Sporosarcina saromensis]MDW0111547.1 YolD-like family protein [Sporosarcina saromensis]
MIRDRGRIKWTAMMLPEHVEQLREWQKEDGYEVRRQPDEQQIEEWNLRIQEALETKEQLVVHYWREPDVVCAKGFIQKADVLEGVLQLQSPTGVAHRIPFVDIKSISDFE